MKPLRNKLQPTRDLGQSIAFLYEELNRTNEAVNRSMGFGQTDKQGEVGDLRAVKNDAEDTFNLMGKGDYGWYSSANDIFQPLGKGNQWLKRLRLDNRGYMQSLIYDTGWQDGKGWKLEETSGNVNAPNYAFYIDDLEVRNNLKVYELLIQQIRAHTGDLLFTPGGGKVKEITTSTQFEEVIKFEDPVNAGTVPVAEGDYIFIKQVDTDKTTAVKTIGRVVRSISGDSVTLYKVDDDNNGTHDLSEVGSIEVGDEFVSIGNVGSSPAEPYASAGITGSDDRQAMIQMSILGTRAPFIRIMDNMNEWKDLFSPLDSFKIQLGNLRGLSGLDGNTITTDQYGLYAKDKVIIGGYDVNNRGIELTTEESTALSTGNIIEGVSIAWKNWSGTSKPYFWIGDTGGSSMDWNFTTEDTLTIVGGAFTAPTITGGTIQTGTSAPYVIMDANGFRIYSVGKFASSEIGWYYGGTPSKYLSMGLTVDLGAVTGSYLDTPSTGIAISDGTTTTTIIGDAIDNDSIDTNDLIVNNRIYNQDIIYPKITEGGTDSNRTLTVQLRQLNGTTNVSTSGLISFWISTSSDPQASDPGKSTYTLNNFSETTGRLIDPTSFSYTALHHGITTTGGAFVITATGHAAGTIRTLYFHCEIQGVVYTEEFTLRESAPA